MGILALPIIISLLVGVGYVIYQMHVNRLEKKLLREEGINQLRKVELKRQSQIIYNLSTSIYLISDVHKIFDNALAEIHSMYEWDNLSFVINDQEQTILSVSLKPSRTTTELYATAARGEEQFTDNSDGYPSYIILLPIGYKQLPYGLLYAGNNHSPFTASQIAFFRIVSHMMAIALNRLTHKGQHHG